MHDFFVPFVIFDMAVTLAVVLFVLKRRGVFGGVLLPPGQGITDLGQVRALTQLATEQHDRIGDFVRANWSGIPAQLPGVLASLMDQLEGDARARGLTVNRELLKTVIATSLRKHRVAGDRELGEALAKVA